MEDGILLLEASGKTWNCPTKWRDTGCRTPHTGGASFAELGKKNELFKHAFELDKMLNKDVLVHGGIEHGIPSPKFTFSEYYFILCFYKFLLLKL